MANQNDRSEESRQHPRRGGNNRRGNGGGGGASSLNNGQKKRPQRGMGVEQLERLRMQEQRNQQMTEMSFGHHHHYPPPPPSPYFYPNPFQHSPDHPIPSVPVMHGPYRVPGGLFGFEPGLIHHNPTHENVVPPAYGSGHGFMDPPPPPPPPYLPYTSKELPSIPIHHLPDPTEYHYKRTRLNDDVFGDGGDKRHGSALSLGNNSSYEGPKLELNTPFNGGYMSSRSGSLAEETKVVAVHRNTSLGENAVMEYDFLSGKGGSSDSYPKEEVAEASSVAVKGSEETSSYITASASPFNNSKASIDLSLKLSF